MAIPPAYPKEERMSDRLPRCKHCGDVIWLDPDMGDGWLSNADDVCGTTEASIDRGHELEEA